MTLTLLIVSVLGNAYLLDKVRCLARELKCKDDDIQYWKIKNEKSKHQYDLMVQWNKSWR